MFGAAKFKEDKHSPLPCPLSLDAIPKFVFERVDGMREAIDALG